MTPTIDKLTALCLTVLAFLVVSTQAAPTQRPTTSTDSITERLCAAENLSFSLSKSNYWLTIGTNNPNAINTDLLHLPLHQDGHGGVYYDIASRSRVLYSSYILLPNDRGLFEVTQSSDVSNKWIMIDKRSDQAVLEIKNQFELGETTSVVDTTHHAPVMDIKLLNFDQFTNPVSSMPTVNITIQATIHTNIDCGFQLGLLQIWTLENLVGSWVGKQDGYVDDLDDLAVQMQSTELGDAMDAQIDETIGDFFDEDSHYDSD